jgi:site-specific DNA-methyltransferase (adenine-specific)
MTTTSSFELLQEDAVSFMTRLPDHSADLVITDPPYESLEKHRARGTTTRLKKSKASSNEWFDIFPNRRFPDLLEQVYRVLRPNAHFYLFCDSETMFAVKPLAEAAGFKFWKPLVWDKVHLGMGYHYRARYEFVLFFEKGRRALNDRSTPDILRVKRVMGGYPTEKPVELLEILVRQSSAAGEFVLDPFMGSGSTGVASVRLGRHFLGNDTCAEAVDVTRTRMANELATERVSLVRASA